MGGRKVRRVGGRAGSRVARWCMRRATLASAMVLLTAYPAARLSAQVGYPPDNSPYHDLKRGRTLILGAGYLSGGRGVVGVGPSDGSMASARFEVPLNKSLAAFLGAAYGRMSRFVADPTKDSAAHISGPVNTDVVILDGGLHLMLTGAKAWHAFAPYAGASGGVMLATSPPADTSGYRFRFKGIFGPELGLRWYVGRRIAVRADARVEFWQLSYPATYKQPSPDGSRVLPVGSADKEWTRHPWIGIGLGWTF
jgi:hypothetical protein